MLSFSILQLILLVTFVIITSILRTAEASSSWRHDDSNENATTTELLWGDVNLLVLTDVHSWIAGHERHESNMNVDYGDVLSFVQRLHRFVDMQQGIGDLYLVMNGDFMDGTGLSTRPPKYLTPLLKEMPFDVINLGNHELYDNETVDFIMDKFIPNWNGRYLTSNTIYYHDRKPLGNRYCILKGKDSTVLTFGFLFNFQGHSKNTIVENVQDVVRQSWFLQALTEETYDSVLVMAHMHVTDPLVQMILDAIRQHTGCSVVFITGHTHIRAYEVLDDNAVSFEAGKFLDTIGFISWNTSQKSNESAMSTEERFPHAFLDTNRDVLTSIVHHANNSTDSLPTIDGIRLTDRIHTTQDKLGLLDIVGCSPHVYSLRAAMNEPLSLWRLYTYSILPQRLLQTPGQVFVQGTNALRYDLMNGKILVDDIITVCPFNDTIYQIADNVSGSKLLEALNISLPSSSTKSLNPNDILPPGSILPLWSVATPSARFLDLEARYQILTPRFHVDYLKHRIANVTGMPEMDEIPVPKHKNRKYHTTTDLWKDYIAANWPCRKSSSIWEVLDSPSPLPMDSSIPDKEERPFMVAVFIVLILLGLWAYTKRRAHYFAYEAIPDANANSSSIARTASQLSLI
jgi:2',3'-cyclic-nucleotide 2'-phosphodiesterase (5'-nucleotidase family)